MELKVIGTGSAGNCYVLTDSRGGRLMLEAGVSLPDTLRELQFDTSRMAGIVLTHEHGDHAKYASAWAKRGQRIYSSSGTFEAITDGSMYWNIAINPVKPGETYNIGSYTVKPFKVKHDAREPLGYLIAHSENKICFITDASACGARTKGVNTFLIECNYDIDSLNQSDIAESLRARIYNAHFSLGACKDFLKKQNLSACKQIVIIHASGDRLEKDKVVTELQAMTGIPVIVAKKRLTIEL